MQAEDYSCLCAEGYEGPFCNGYSSKENFIITVGNSFKSFSDLSVNLIYRLILADLFNPFLH